MSLKYFKKTVENVKFYETDNTRTYEFQGYLVTGPKGHQSEGSLVRRLLHM